MKALRFNMETEGLLGQIVDPVAILDQQANLLYFNTAFKALSGYGEEIAGVSIDLFLEEHFIPVKNRLLKKVLKAGRPTSIEAKMKAADGRLIPLLVSASLVKLKNKKTDFSPDKRHYRKTEELAAAQRKRSPF